jgi:hypothetical protein
MTDTVYILLYVGEEWQEEETELISVHATLAGSESYADGIEDENWGDDANPLEWTPYDESESAWRASALQSGPYYYEINKMTVKD